MFCSDIYGLTVVNTAVVVYCIFWFLIANVKNCGTALSSHLSINLSKNYSCSRKRINELIHIVVTACRFFSVKSFHKIRLNLLYAVLKLQARVNLFGKVFSHGS